MEEILSKIDLSKWNPEMIKQSLDAGYIKYIGIICILVFVLSLIGRGVSHGQSVFSNSVGTTIGILFMYMIVIGVHKLDLVPNFPALPFADVVNDRLYLLPITQTEFQMVCFEFLKLFLLAFFVALLDHYLPDPDGFLLWVIRCMFLLALAFACQVLISRVIIAYAPAFLVKYAPYILLGCMILVLLMGVIKLILGIAITAMNPILGGIYSFFFMHRLGRQLTSATISTVLLGGILYVTDRYGYTVMTLENSNLVICIPFLVILLVIWYFM